MSNVNIGTKMRTLDVGQKQAAYTGVIVHAGQTEDGQSIDYSVGNDTGSVLEVTVPNGTLTLAYMLLDKLKLRGYRYQPFEADGAIADPSIEIGDNITANNVPSIVMGINTNHSRLMASTLKAPFDEEVNHEWQYEPRSERQFKRESAYTRSRLTINENEISAEVIRATDAENILSGRITVTATDITAEVARATAAEGVLRSSIQINADNITAEVTRATGAEGNLSTRITQNADSITSEVTRATTAEGNLSTRITQNATSISSEVTRATTAEGNLSSRITQNATDITAKVSKSGGSSSSFAWTLTDSSWTLTSNGSTVLQATSSGIEVSGKITATSGNIGGFEIDYNSLGKSTPDVTTSGAKQHQVLLFAPDSVDGGTGAIRIRHREYDGSSYGSWVNDFLVQYNGRVTASDLHINGGEISIGNNFRVDSSGNLTANSGSFRGNVSAGNIQYGGNYGTFSGSGLTDYSIGGAKYGLSSIANGNMVDSTLTTGKMVSGIGTSLGYANFSNSVFNNSDTAPYMNAEYYFIHRNSANYSMSLHTHYFYVRDGYIYMSSNGGESDSVDWTGGEQGFNIADTQYYKDAVDAAESAGAAGVEVNSIVITNITERTTAYYVTVEIGLSNGVTTTQTRLYNK